jgi:hypothetical protein
MILHDTPVPFFNSFYVSMEHGPWEASLNWSQLPLNLIAPQNLLSHSPKKNWMTEHSELNGNKLTLNFICSKFCLCHGNLDFKYTFGFGGKTHLPKLLFLVYTEAVTWLCTTVFDGVVLLWHIMDNVFS